MSQRQQQQRKRRQHGGGRSFGQLSSREKRSRTGVIGVSYTQVKARKRGVTQDRSYFQTSAFGSCFVYCIETLGRHEAWRRALQKRAEWERLPAEERARYARRRKNSAREQKGATA